MINTAVFMSFVSNLYNIHFSLMRCYSWFGSDQQHPIKHKHTNIYRERLLSTVDLPCCWNH